MGCWREGRITAWITIPGLFGWECQVDADLSPGDPSWPGRYEFHPRVIRPRYPGDPPPEPLGPLG
jgi:hypothetical protein